MKTLIKYIKESKFTKISTQWMIDHYIEYNDKYFNNELPSADDVDIQYTSDQHTIGRALGCQGFHKEFYVNRSRMVDGMYRMLYENNKAVENILDLKPFIYINNNIPMAPDKYEDTLIHEMIHLWVCKDRKYPRQAHGKEFKAKCKEVRDLARRKYSKRYELTTYADNPESYDKEASIKYQLSTNKNLKNIVGIYIEFDGSLLVDKNNEKIFLFCTRSASQRLIDYSLHTHKRFNPTIYVTENSYEPMCVEYGMFKTVTTFKYYMVSKFDNKENIYKIMTMNAKVIKDNINESIWNSKIDIKPEDLKDLIYVPANINLSDYNIEDEYDTIEIHEPDDSEIK